MSRKKIRFLVIIPTFNRKLLLRETIVSLLNQTYSDWVLRVSDSANTLVPEDLEVIGSANLAQCALWQYGQELSSIEHWNAIIARVHKEKINFDYFVLLGDDDLLAPQCLERVALHADKAGVIAVNAAQFSEANKILTVWKSPSTRALERISSPLVIGNALWGNGASIPGFPSAPCPMLGPTHVSGFFLSKSILENVRDKFKELWIPPFGDVGLLQAVFLADGMTYLNTPLVVIRFHESIGMQFKSRNRFGLLKGHRSQPDPCLPNIVCFSLFSLETYVRALRKIWAFNRVKLSIRLYLRVFKEIWSDHPKNGQTFWDILQLLRWMLFSLDSWISLPKDFELWLTARRADRRARVLKKFDSIQLAATALGVIDES